MNAREDILGRIRSALAGAEPPTAPHPPAAPHPLAETRPAETEALTALFVERVEDYRAVVSRCSPDEVPEVVAAALPGTGGVLVPDGFPWSLPDTVAQVADATLPAHELDRLAAVVTTATVGIAETGTLVLDHGPGQGRRALTLVPDVHVCVVTEDQVVRDVADALGLLDPVRPTTWISGPSATSDIELDRVEGVHGPRNLVVVLVAETRDPKAGVGVR